MTTTIVDMERWLAENLSAQQAETSRHSSEITMLKRQYDQLKEQRDLALHGVDPEDLAVAKAVIFVRGSVEESAEGAFQAAVEMLAAHGVGLEREYVGAKRYDRFHQMVRCTYGSVPSHGDVVFTVGLSDTVRKRHKASILDTPLTENEAEAAIRWLHTLRLQGAVSREGSMNQYEINLALKTLELTGILLDQARALIGKGEQSSAYDKLVEVNSSVDDVAVLVARDLA